MNEVLKRFKDGADNKFEIFECFMFIRYFGKLFEDAFTFVAKQRNLTFPQFLVLTIVYIGEGRKISEIARIGSWTLPTVIHLLDTLSQKGLIEMVPVGKGKGKLVFLTEQGKELEKNFSGSYTSKLKRFLDVIGDRMETNLAIIYNILRDVDGGEFEGLLKSHVSEKRSGVIGHKD